MKKIFLMVASLAMLTVTSCRTAVVTGRPAPRHHWWHHRHVQREVIIVK